ncbi:hypothetical protein QQ73_08815, partial [Candidatus Endoriftia persephone str. Guaymas]|nr:hypothetical protein [Candidatus Endoriftia persephone str. Guaymas]
ALHAQIDACLPGRYYPPEAGKGKTKLSYIRHLLTENRQVVAVDTHTTLTSGHANQKETFERVGSDTG